MPPAKTLLVATLAGCAAAAAPPIWAQTAPPVTVPYDPRPPTPRPEEMQVGPLRAYDIDKDGTLDRAELAGPAGQALIRRLR